MWIDGHGRQHRWAICSLAWLADDAHSGLHAAHHQSPSHPSNLCTPYSVNEPTGDVAMSTHGSAITPPHVPPSPWPPGMLLMKRVSTGGQLTIIVPSQRLNGHRTKAMIKGLSYVPSQDLGYLLYSYILFYTLLYSSILFICH